MAQGLDAQELPRALESRAPVVYIDFAGLASNAVGEFGDLVGAGGGVNLSAKVFPLEDSRNFGLRADLGWVIYGSESVPTCISDPCRVQTDIKTSNNIFYFGLGPEVILIRGRFEPYVYGTLGTSVFNTGSTLQGEYFNGADTHFNTTHLNDWTFAWRAGGGIRYGIWEDVSVDFGVEHHGNGVADYLTKGDVIDGPDGKVSINPRRSEANLLTFRLGVSLGLGGDEGIFAF
jgi:opacity protein-like surface antigen